MCVCVIGVSFCRADEECPGNGPCGVTEYQNFCTIDTPCGCESYVCTEAHSDAGGGFFNFSTQGYEAYWCLDTEEVICSYTFACVSSTPCFPMGLVCNIDPFDPGTPVYIDAYIETNESSTPDSE